MSKHEARVAWSFSGEDFRSGRYSREHSWTFDGGQVVAASASPAVVRAPYSNPAGVDPEEAFIAAISSCHLLTFLHLASRQGLDILSYEDHAVGVLTKNDAGVPWVSSVVLRPRVVYGANPPGPELEARLHHEAHEQCFIACSVKTAISVEL